MMLLQMIQPGVIHLCAILYGELMIIIDETQCLMHFVFTTVCFSCS